MLPAIANFANDAAGVEKSLRLLQSITQITAGLATSPQDAAPWVLARGHFALARRFLRLFKWIDCSLQAQRTFQSNPNSLRTVLETGKWSLLAMYFLLEMCTITNAMRITTTTWGPTFQIEALKFWLYAIVVSILLSLYDLFFVAPAPATTATATTPTSVSEEPVSTKTSPSNPASKTTPSTNPAGKAPPAKTKLYKQLVIDGCDLLIPASAIGWIDIDPVIVGVAMAVSSLIAGWEIWGRVQARSSAL